MAFAGIDLNNLKVPKGTTATWGRPGRLTPQTLLDLFANAPEWQGFLASNPFVEDNNNNEHWIPQRPLGAGSFGKVALFSKKNHLGEIIDNIAIKQRYLAPTPLVRDGLWKNSLAKEAFIQSQLTTNDTNRCILPLRRYKHYPAMRQCRVMTEFAPFGTLDTIRARYQAWDKFLPELFLWCLFEKLAYASLLMQTCPGQWQPMTHDPKDQAHRSKFILHLDIKPANIYIFEREPFEDRSRKLPQYGFAMLGDFGLSEVTKPNNANNPHRLTAGTPNYLPPEAPFRGLRFDTNWNTPVHTADQKYLEKHNVWSIGKTMFDLMTLDPPELVHDLLNNLQEADYRIPPAANNSLGEHFVGEIFTGHIDRDKEYSARLRSLVRECLRPDMNLRPSSVYLLNRVRQAKQGCIDEITRAPRQDLEVCFTTAEMNELPYDPEGVFQAPNHRNERDWSQWLGLRNGDCLAPDEPVLEPPVQKFRRFYARELTLPQKPKTDVQGKRWKQIGNMVQFKPNLDELNDRENIRNRPPKRMRSWDSAVEQDVNLQAKLRDLRNRTRNYAGTVPVNMFNYVLENERMVVNKAEEALSWLYGAHLDPDWEWLQEQHLTEKARRVRDRLLTECKLDKKLKECKYFVSTSAHGVQQVDQALEKMRNVFEKG